MNTFVGTQCISGRYRFGEDCPLVEAARAAYEMGSNILKFSMTEQGISEKACGMTLAQMAERYEPFRTVLDMPFEYYCIWAQPAIDWHRMPTDETERYVYTSLYDLTAHLLRTYNGSGKTFLLGNWEGDWLLLGGFTPEKDGDPEVARSMLEFFRIRQKAIEDARAAVPHENVRVGGYIEVNRVLDAKDKDMCRLTNRVLPHVAVDLVSYSSYDSLMPFRVTEALDYIESRAVFTDYFTGVFDRKVFVGEYDGYFDYHVMGPSTPEMQKYQTNLVISAALAWGSPFVLFWEMYNNEYERLREGDGFWLIDENNVKQPTYYLHRDYLVKLTAARCAYAHFGGNLHRDFLLPAMPLLSRRKVFEIVSGVPGIADRWQRECEKGYETSAEEFARSCGFDKRKLPSDASGPSLWKKYLNSRDFTNRLFENRKACFESPDAFLRVVFPWM